MSPHAPPTPAPAAPARTPPPAPTPALLHLFRLCAQTPQGQLLLSAATRFHLEEPAA
ncbi:MAG: hypothetical protein ACT4NV_17185 [Rhodoferax sp.]